MKRCSEIASLIGCVLLVAPGHSADEPTPPVRGPATPQEEVAALFQARCVKCHGGDKPKSSLDLTSLESLSRGGKRGTVLVPGKTDDSRLWKVVHENEMPPEQPLPDTEKALLKEWIKQGAPGVTTIASGHWAFRALKRPSPPAVNHAENLRTDVDRFIEFALEKKQSSLAAEADRPTLIRRVCFDLTGLPPTLAEIEVFLADRSPDAYERMVEQYLSSPRYGERWGKFWLDTAGYADSNGYWDSDTDRPLAYKYRDYVIRSFNTDKPYDRFVLEQLAGDEAVGFIPTGDLKPEMVESLIATHFLRNAPDGTADSDGNPDEVRTDRYAVLEGNLQITMNALLGLTVQCARCHSHKLEPISQEEYYRLEAIFYPAYSPERWKIPAARVLSIGSKAEREENQRLTARIERQVKALQAGLKTIVDPYRDQMIEERLSELGPVLRAEVLKAVNTAKEKQSKEQQALLKKHEAALKISDDDLANRFPEFGKVRDEVRKAINEREKEHPRPLEKISALVETDPKPLVHHLLKRGVHSQPGQEVQPGVVGALCSPSNNYRIEAPAEGQVSTGRRTAFARWVTSPDNPLFARVMVNRIWQHHFGTGIVSTPDNLGQSGARPTHPELIDYLASEFIRSGWSIKAMHRLILHSAVYRQSGSMREDAWQVDPDNHLLWRFPLRRLDAEALRDALLAISGELDLRPAAPYVPTKRTSVGDVEVDEKHPGAHRRSVFLQQRRSQVPTLLALFDAPAIVVNCSARNTSTVPSQSLALLNSDFARKRAAAFAKRLEREAGADKENQLNLAFRLACGREPSPEERRAVEKFLVAQQPLYANQNDGEQRAWTDFCQMLLASNACLYVE